MNPNATGSFSINAKTCTLKYNSQTNGETIFGGGTKYIIPIYQRPYSWSDGQIKKFLSDIFASYFGLEGINVEEPMFIGTMQLSYKNIHNEQEIIDGQQRLTTFLMLLKVLKHKYVNCKTLDDIKFDWLSTRVNNGKQQTYLEEAIDKPSIAEEATLNPYLKNCYLINRVIDEEIVDEEGSRLDFDIDRFILHLFSNVYFVVIETRAGLSKTLQIFNAINTTGLDLNGGDIFKIRMYEYMRDRLNADESAFDEISQLYKKLDDYDSKLGYKVIDIRGVLNIYQYILIAKYNLPVTLYTYATETFFERLFDTIFKINQWEHFKNNVKNIELSVKDIDRIIEVRYEWENTNYVTAENACAIHFIWWSRYGKYWNLVFVFLYKFKDEEEYWDKMLLFATQLSKLYVIYSVRFLKAINEIHTFTYSLIKAIINKPFDDVINLLNKKIGKLENHKGWGDIELAITGDITYNAKIKNILCRLSAMLEEEYQSNDNATVEAIRTKLFETPVDIEHIQSYHDSNGDKRIDIWETWKDNINSIGNLMILEQSINRSISNNPYNIKIQSYASSSFTIVKKQFGDYSDWDLMMCNNRKDKEAQKIFSYIFNTHS